MSDWTAVDQVAKDDQGKFMALVGGQWVPAAGGAKSEDGKYMAFGMTAAAPSAPAVPAEPTMTSVLSNAAYKGAAAVPDTLLNAPNRVMNIGRAAFGSAATALGRPDLAPDLKPDPDLARRALEAIGLINPSVQPQGAVQKTADVLTQGAVGGALTGGASVARTVAGAGMGALSSGMAAGAKEATGSDAIGAAAGLLVPAAVAKVAARPNLSPNVRMLADEGVQMTPGQIKGGTLRRIEDAATSVPILGDAIKGAQRRGIESFDAAAINRALKPIGDELPAGLTGNKAIEYAHGKLSDAYDGLLPKLRGDLDATQPVTTGAGPNTPAPTFRQELESLRTAAKDLPPEQRSQLNDVIDKEVIGQFTNGGVASGETLKNIESLLGTLAKKKANSDNYHENTLGLAFQEIQAAMRRMVNSTNPAHEGELAKVNEGYANFKRVQGAASKVNATDGVFSPAQLNQAVRAGDRSKDKARFSEGNALMQDLSNAGKSTLSPTVPDSGTGLRAALLYSLAHPLKAVGLAIPAAAATLPYTGMGQRAIQDLLTTESPNLAAAAQRAVVPLSGTANQGLGLAFPQDQQPQQKKAELPAPAKKGYRVKVLSHDKDGRVAELMILPHDGEEATGTLQ